MQEQEVLLPPRVAFEEAAVRQGAAAKDERLRALGSGSDQEQTILLLQLAGDRKEEVVG